MFENRSMKVLTLGFLKLLVGALASVEIIIFAINMSFIAHQFTSTWQKPFSKWFFLYLTFIVAMFMGNPMGCGIVISRTNPLKGENPLRWGLLIIPLRIAAIVFLTVELATFHYMIIPNVLTTCAIFGFYGFALKVRIGLRKKMVEKVGQEQPTIVELHVSDLNGGFNGGLNGSVVKEPLDEKKIGNLI